MFGVRRKRLNQDESWDREREDTEMGPDTPGMSAARTASKSSSCSSGESDSSDSGGPWNKCPLSCLQGNGGLQSVTAELAVASKIPHRGKAPLASKCNKVHPATYHNKHRPEHVKDRVLSGSTQGGASKPTQSQDILRSKNKMKHLFRKTNIPWIIESGRPLSAETWDYFLGGATPVPRLSTFDILSSESEEEEEDEEEDEEEEEDEDEDEDEDEEEEEGEDDLFASCWDTFRERDLISFPRTVFCNAHSRHCLQSVKSRLSRSRISGRASIGIPSPLPEQTRQPCAALLPPNKVNRGFVAFSRQLQKLQSGSRPSQTDLASSHRTSFCQRQSSVVSGEEDGVQSKTSTTNTLQSSNECYSPSTSGQLDDLNVDDEADIQDCQAVQEGAPAAQTSQSLQDSNKETLCRLNQRLSNEEIQCRICYCGDSSPNNPLLSPCLCSGSLQFIHFYCLKRWIKAKIESGSELNIVKRCEICKEALTLDRDTFDLNDYYRRHRRQHQVSTLLAFPYRIRMRLRRTREWGAPHHRHPPDPLASPFFNPLENMDLSK